MSFQCKLEEKNYVEILKSLRETYKSLGLSCNDNLDWMISNSNKMKFLWVIFNEEDFLISGGNLEEKKYHKTIDFVELMDMFVKKYMLKGDVMFEYHFEANSLYQMMENIVNHEKGYPVKEKEYIIGSIHKTTKVMSISAQPTVHTDINVAKKEAERLAKLHIDKKFVVLKFEGICSAENVVWK